MELPAWLKPSPTSPRPQKRKFAADGIIHRRRLLAPSLAPACLPEQLACGQAQAAPVIDSPCVHAEAASPSWRPSTAATQASASIPPQYSVVKDAAGPWEACSGSGQVLLKQHKPAHEPETPSEASPALCLPTARCSAAMSKLADRLSMGNAWHDDGYHAMAAIVRSAPHEPYSAGSPQMVAASPDQAAAKVAVMPAPHAAQQQQQDLSKSPGTGSWPHQQLDMGLTQQETTHILALDECQDHLPQGTRAQEPKKRRRQTLRPPVRKAQKCGFCKHCQRPDLRQACITRRQEHDAQLPQGCFAGTSQ